MSSPQIGLLGIRTQLILISHLMLYLMPTLEEHRPELYLKCLVKWLVPHTCRYVSQIFARYPKHTVTFLCLKFVLLILRLGPIVQKKRLLKYLLTYIHVLQIEQVDSYTYDILNLSSTFLHGVFTSLQLVQK